MLLTTHPPFLSCTFEDIRNIPLAKRLNLPPTTAFQWLAQIRFETTATLYEHNRLMAQHHPIPIHFENVNLAPRT